MKIAFILLLGFAGLFPATCSNDITKKQSKQARPAHHDSGFIKTDIALYGPVILVKNTQRNA